MKRAVLAAALVAAALPAVAHGDAPAPAPAGDAAARAAAWAARYRAVAERLPEARPLADAITGAVAAAPASETFDYALALDAGDLDGDGGNDIADLRVHESLDTTTGAYTVAVRVEAYRGRDGALLWSVALPGDYPTPVFTKVGAAGKAGMIVMTESVTGVDELVAGAGAGEKLIYAYDGRGTLLWEVAAPVAGGGTLVGGGETGMYVDDFGDLVPGGGTDLLMETYTGVGAGDPTEGTVLVSQGRVQLSVVDGATGARRDLGEAFLTDDFVFGAVVGDLTGDRVADVAAVAGPPGDRALRARRSSDGAEVWAAPVGADTEPYASALPDMTGDGRAEVGLYEYGRSDGTETFTLFDGASGRVLWKPQPAADIVPLGNIDGRPGAEVAVVRELESRASVGIKATAVTAAGRTVWSVTRSVSTSGLSAVRASASAGDVGDVQPDGVRDIGYAVTALPMGATGRRDEGTIDGRTGRVMRDPVPDMRGTKAAIDGRGSDGYTRATARGVVTLTAWRGDRPAKLWESAVPTGADGDMIQGSYAATTDRDRCAEIVVSVTGARTTTVVFSGATGAPLWALTRSGDARGVVSKPKARSVKRYARTC